MIYMYTYVYNTLPIFYYLMPRIIPDKFDVEKNKGSYCPLYLLLLFCLFFPWSIVNEHDVMLIT